MRRRATRLAFLVDGERYFAALRQALLGARSQILLAGWEVNSQTRLVRDSAADGPVTLGECLRAAADRGVLVRVLVWDGGLLYAGDREPDLAERLGDGASERVAVVREEGHTTGASHHQKLVVVDDRVGFIGGLDVTLGRWDTPEHAPDDPRRDESPHLGWGAFHDMQVAVSGPAAGALGELFRARWRAARGDEVPAAQAGSEPWPPDVTPDLRDVDVCIARTGYTPDGRPIHEIAALWKDAVAAARRTIYIESQFVTSRIVGRLLVERLQERSGPEVVVVTQLEAHGALEQLGAQVPRTRLFSALRRADVHGHLRVYVPCIPGLAHERFTLHSKVLIVDDTLVRVGSSNLTDRSMAVDTEADLALEAQDERVAAAASALRDRLLAEHLGTDPEAVGRAVAEHGSLVGAIEALRRPDTCRTLAPLSLEEAGWTELAPASALLDPDRPMVLAVAEQTLSPDAPRRSLLKTLLRFFPVVLVVGGAVAWRSSGADAGELLEQVRSAIEHTRWVPLLVPAVFLAGTLLVVPVNVLVVLVALTMSAPEAMLWSLVGSLVGAVVSYGIGRLAFAPLLERLRGARTTRVKAWLEQRGVLAVAAVRMVPVAPFTVVNAMAGAARVRFSHYFFGTLAGVTPGIVAMTLFGDRLRAVLEDPEPRNVTVLVGVAAAVAAAAIVVARRVGAHLEHRAT